MPSENEVRQTLLSAIDKAAQSFTHPVQLLALAEALAWLSNPSQPHGSSTNVQS